MVTLYAGGQYHLYTFKKYTDIRLVFAPEKQIAFFGGDPDNFEYPRYDLDVCFFRVYENDKPLKCEHYLKWSAGRQRRTTNWCSSPGTPAGPTAQNTVAELKYLRDTGYPYLLQPAQPARSAARARGAAAARRTAQRGEDELFGIQNSRKARIGGLAGLLDPKLMGRKEAEREAAEGRSSPRRQRDAGRAVAGDAAEGVRRRSRRPRRCGPN